MQNSDIERSRTARPNSWMKISREHRIAHMGIPGPRSPVSGEGSRNGRSLYFDKIEYGVLHQEKAGGNNWYADEIIPRIIE